MTTKDEFLTISAIADRFMQRFDGVYGGDKLSLCMDIEYAHREHPIRLTDLLDAADTDPVSFVHDVSGIYANLNRETLRLENCFVPRFSA